MAFTEALARGLPVVGTSGGATPWTVPADAGILVRPGDDAALAGALESVLPRTPDDAAAQHRSRLAEGARRHAHTLPTWEQAALGFATALLELAPERARAS